jgi:hypothetical protein
VAQPVNILAIQRRLAICEQLVDHCNTRRANGPGAQRCGELCQLWRDGRNHV